MDAQIKTIEHGDASRLPEPIWFWRRILIYVCVVVALVILTVVCWRVMLVETFDIGTARLIIRYCFYTIWSAVVLYGVGASVTDVAVLVAAVRTTRKETIASAPAAGSVTQDGSTAETRSELPEQPAWRR